MRTMRCMTQLLRALGSVFGRRGRGARYEDKGTSLRMYDSMVGRSKRGPSAALRARERRGKGKDARNSAQGDGVAPRQRGGWRTRSQVCAPGTACCAPTTFAAAGRVGVVRGYDENLYTRGRNRASTCWCKERSSTVKPPRGARLKAAATKARAT